MSKIIHYCWFGGNPFPASATEYMKSWQKYCPDFTLKRWDESNFDIHTVPFVEEAYTAKKWAFVSDYVRTFALYEQGGLYVDTDVEFIRPIDDLLGSSFAGFETHDVVAPGLILYAHEPKTEFYKKLLDKYNGLHFDEQSMNEVISPKIYTEMLESMGLKKDNSLQKVGGVTIYPMEYFQPWGENWRKKKITSNTRTVHHYDASWLDKTEKEYYCWKKTYGEFWGRVLFSIKHPKCAWQKYRNSKARGHR